MRGLSTGVCLYLMLIIYSSIFRYLITVVPVLVNVAFITLLERKILGLSQSRKGPNKVGIGGVVQPFRDAIKLFSKEVVTPWESNPKQFFFAPVIALTIVLLTYLFYPFNEVNVNIRLGALFLYIIIRINVFPVIIRGWSSNSKYALVGRLRGIAQTVSYEVRFALVLLFFLGLTATINILSVLSLNNFWRKLLMFIPIVIIFFISSLAETNRTPFDFAEGESELVSGFNVEYGSVGFAFIFMAEYARILLLSILISLFLIVSSTNSGILVIIVTRVVFLWVWVRTTFPRYRYDKLINLAWKVYLPIRLSILIYSISIRLL